MSKRVNISLDDETYQQLDKIKKRYGFKNCHEMIVACTHVFLRCMADADDRRLRMEANDQTYIRGMFDLFTNATIQPDGTVPKKGYAVHIDSKTWQKTKNT